MGKRQFGVFQLAPLQREDVRQAAADHGHDPDELLAAVIDRDIVALAIKPITLSLLLDLAAEPGGMPTSQLEVYRRGLRRLAAEPSERRDRAGDTQGQLGTGARLAIAERIAGATLLTGRSVITLNESADGTSDVVTRAARRRNRAGSRDRTSHTVRRAEDKLREVLGSGLFFGRGDDLGWAHQTYGEFLAARYLATSALDPQSLLALADDRDGRVVPQRRDVAGWGVSPAPTPGSRGGCVVSCVPR